MINVVKLTDENMRTHGDTQWVLGTPVTALGVGELCSRGWIHAYEIPTGAALEDVVMLAVLLNPGHGGYAYPGLRAWLGEAPEIGLRDGPVKVGVRSLTLVRELVVPEVTLLHRQRFAWSCALAVSRDEGFRARAEAWLAEHP